MPGVLGRRSSCLQPLPSSFNAAGSSFTKFFFFFHLSCTWVLRPASLWRPSPPSFFLRRGLTSALRSVATSDLILFPSRRWQHFWAIFILHSCQVCLAAALLHRISPLRAVAMVISQCGGAIAAAALVLGITGIARDHFPGLQKTDISLEFMLSFLAVLVQLGAGGGQGQGLSLESLFSSFQKF